MYIENEEPFNIYEYIKDNFIGILLLILAVFIVYFVDYINNVNMVLFQTPSPIPFANNTPVLSLMNTKQKRNKKR